MTMLPADTYVQPGAVDPVLDNATVMRLVRAHVPRASAVTAIDESGGEARTYMVDDDLVLKTQRPQQLRARTSLEKEVRFLRAIAAETDVPAPRVLGYGRDGSTEYTVMSRIPGVAAVTLPVEGEARLRLLRAVGGVLRRVHRIHQEPFVADPSFPGIRTVADFENRLEATFARSVALLNQQPELWPWSEAPQTLASRVLAMQRPNVELVALHSNPGPEHIFVDPHTLELTGIIDFGDAYVGHPAFDMRWPRPEDREALLTGYGRRSDDAIPAWLACTILADMTTIAARPDRRAAARQTLEAILETL